MSDTSKSSVLKLGLRLTIAIVLVILFLGGSGFYYLFNHPFGDGSRHVEFEVRHGAGSYSVSRDLQREQLIDDANRFRLMLRLTGQVESIKAGYYELNNGMSPMEIARILTEGRVRMTNFTIPEGWHNKQIAELMVKKGYASDKNEFLRLTRNREILSKYHIPGESTEGYLFPDTYTIPVGYPLEKIHEAMLRRFFSVLNSIDGASNASPDDVYNRLILASIIEREAAIPEELPVMASVFLNRIQKEMRLESCATVQYLLPEPREKLYNRDLLIPSPYNTYRNQGFPPGPISNPGAPALKAAFQPDDTDYLFFVLKPDRTHYFSSSYSEHLKAKKRYLGE